MSSTKPRRVKSAKARLSPSQSSHPTLEPKSFQTEQLSLVKEAQERVKSAKAIRDKHNASAKVFPRPSSRATKERFASQYSKDFDGTFTPPAELRPTSPTRRNNPHPGKQFMVWRVPTREIGVPAEPEGLELPPEYITRSSDFDAIDELNRGIGSLRLPPPQPTSMEYGAYLRQQREAQRQQAAAAAAQLQQGVRTRHVGPEVLDRTIRDDTSDGFQEWLASASPQEQQTILKMLKSAEDAQVNETISTVMEPTAAKAVKGWLKGADQKERDVAVRLFSSLGSRQGRRRQRSNSVPNISRPLSRQPLPPPLQAGSGQKQHGRRLPSSSGSRAAAPPNKPWPAGIWHHMPVRDPPPQVYHRGALFGAVRGDASHYNVHPEWPDYYNTSRSSDTVH